MSNNKSGVLDVLLFCRVFLPSLHVLDRSLFSGFFRSSTLITCRFLRKRSLASRTLTITNCCSHFRPRKQKCTHPQSATPATGRCCGRWRGTISGAPLPRPLYTTLTYLYTPHTHTYTHLQRNTPCDVILSSVSISSRLSCARIVCTSRRVSFQLSCSLSSLSLIFAEF